MSNWAGIGGGGGSVDATIRARVQGAAQAASELHQVAAAARETGAAASTAGRAAAGAERGWSAWSRAMRWLQSGSIVYGVYSLARSLFSIGQNAISTGVAFDSMQENSTIAFTAMLGNAQKAHDMLRQLFDLAAHTPFTLTNVQTAAQTLLAMGFASERVVPMLTKMSNLIAANPMLGADAVPRLAVVLGQIRSAGRLLGQDALQLVSFGIDPYAVVAQQLGKTRSEVKKLGEQGKLDGQQTVDAILAYADRRFKGLAEAQSHTYEGLKSTLGDTYRMAMGAMLKPFMPDIEGGLQSLIDELNSPGFQAGSARFGQWVRQTVIDLKPFWRGLVDVTRILGMLAEPLTDSSMGSGLVSALDALGESATFVRKALEVIPGAERAIQLPTQWMADRFRDASVAVDVLRRSVEGVKSVLDWIRQHGHVGAVVDLTLKGPWSTLTHFVGSLPGAHYVGQAVGGAATGVGYATEAFSPGGALRIVDRGLSAAGIGDEPKRPSRRQPAAAAAAPVEQAPSLGGDIILQVDGRELARVSGDVINRRKRRR